VQCTDESNSKRTDRRTFDPARNPSKADEPLDRAENRFVYLGVCRFAPLEV
jgi:hypothetical protein